MNRATILAAAAGVVAGALLTTGLTAVAQPPRAGLCTGLSGDALTTCLYSELDDRLRANGMPPASPSASPSASVTPSVSPSPSASQTPTQPPTGTTPNGPIGTWNLRFADEFNGTAVDQSKWTDKSSSQSHLQQGNKSNGQLEWNQMANCSVRDGKLILEAKRGPVTKSGVTYNWTSCLLTTGSAYTFQYGYVEIRSKQPACNSGMWPAFWTWQAPGANTQREIDVYEYWPSWAGKCQQFTNGTHGNGMGGSAQGWNAYPTSTTAQAWNTYGAETSATGTRFYLNGQLVRSVPNKSDGPMSLIVNLAVWADVPPPASSNGAVKEVDYIRAWQR